MKKALLLGSLVAGSLAFGNTVAVAQLAATRPEVRLVQVYKPTYYHHVPEAYRDIPWIGDTGRMAKDLRELAAGLGITDQVTLTKALDRHDLYLAAADMLVVPFLNERFSSVHPLEGFAHGLPAIATDLGEQRILIRDGEHGPLVSPGDEAALTVATGRLAADPALRAAMGRAAGHPPARARLDANA